MNYSTKTAGSFKIKVINVLCKFIILPFIVLIFTSIHIFAADNDGMIVYSEQDESQPKYRIWDSENLSWSSENQASLGTTYDKYWVVLKNCPRRREKVLGFVESGGYSLFQVWKEKTGSWSTEYFYRYGGKYEYRIFDIAYEQNSGDAIVVFSTDTEHPSYRIWKGDSWGNQHQIYLQDSSDGNVSGGKPNFINLVSRPGSDEIMLGLVNDNDEIWAARWTGSSWENFQRCTSDASHHERECFAMSWETISGECLFMYGEGSNTDIKYRIFSSGSWSGENSGPDIGEQIYWLVSASDPASDRIGLASHDGSNYGKCCIWDGSQWKNYFELSSLLEEAPGSEKGNRAVGISWIGDTGKCMSAGIGRNNDYFSYTVWDQNNGWSPVEDSSETGGSNIQWISLKTSKYKDEIIADFNDIDWNLFTNRYVESDGWQGHNQMTGNTLQNRTSRLSYFSYDTPVPPAQITDFKASPGTDEGDIDLSWTYPGDDGMEGGDASEFTLKYSSESVIWNDDEFNDNELNYIWRSKDIRTSGGRVTETGGELIITGNGADIWDPYDEFHIVYSTVSGDFDLITKINEQENTNSWAKAGIMVRNSLNQGSSYEGGYCIIAVTPGNGWTFQWDGEPNGYLDGYAKTGTSQYPCYVRLKKEGKRFTGYYSTDGTNWNEVDSRYLSNTSTTQIAGLFVCSHSDGELCTAKFDYIRGGWNKSLDGGDYSVLGSPGQTQSGTAPNKDPKNTYYFSIKTQDEVPVTSLCSNSPGTMPAGFPPAAVTTLSALTGESQGEINLSWISPGDDGTIGELNPGKFKIQYSKVSGISWSSDNAQIIKSTQCPALSERSTVITGLEGSTTYYFRIWTCDDWDLCSGISNGATCMTFIPEEDTTPPACSISSVYETSDYIYSPDTGTIYYNSESADSSFTLKINASDDEDNLDRAEGSEMFGDTPQDTEEGSPPEVYELTYSIEQDSADEGNIIVTVYDSAGNKSTATIEIIRDSSPPGTPGNPLCRPDSFSDEGEYDNDTKIYFTWSSTTDTGGAGIDTYLAEINAPEPSKDAGTDGQDTDKGEEGENTYYVRARDRVGNLGPTSSDTITIDLSTPVVNNVHLQSESNHTAGDGYQTDGGVEAGTTQAYIDYDSIEEENPNETRFSHWIYRAGEMIKSSETWKHEDTVTPDPEKWNFEYIPCGADKLRIGIAHYDKVNQHEFKDKEYYVKPYTPQKPDVSTGTLTQATTTLFVNINPHSSEHPEVEYSIHETSTDKFMQDDGTLASGEVFQTTTTWGRKKITGLNPNKNYTFEIRSKNHYSNVYSSYSLTHSTWTLSVAPDWDNISSNQSIGTPYADQEFTFTNESGFGPGGVEYYRVAWDTFPTHQWTGSEDIWTGNISTTRVAGFPSDSWYFHIKGFNGADRENGTLDYGPMWYSTQVPTIEINWPVDDQWYTKIISSYSGTVDDNSNGEISIDTDTFQYNYNSQGWQGFKDEDGSYPNWLDTNEIPESNEGKHQLMVKVFNVAGSTATSKICDIKVDTSPPSGVMSITFDDVGISSMTVIGAQLVDATQGDVYYEFQCNENDTYNREWKKDDNTNECEGMTANKEYTFWYKAKDGLDNETDWSMFNTRYTLSIPPSNDTISCNKSTRTWYQNSSFTFTANGFGQGYVEYYKVKWDTNPLCSSWPETWSSDVSTTRAAGFSSDSWYFHIKGYNGEGVANGTFDYGPFWFSTSAPTITLDWPESDKWYSTAISSYSGAIVDNSPEEQGIDTDTLYYNYNNQGWVKLNDTVAQDSWIDTDEIPDTDSTSEQGVELELRITDNTGVTGYSEIYTIKVDPTAPAPPDNLVWQETESGGIFYSNTEESVADWNNSSDVSGIDSYRIQVDEDSKSFSSPIYDSWVAGKSSETVSGLSNGHYYYYRIKAKNGAGLEGDWSDSSYALYVDTVPPGKPALVSPEHDSSTSDDTPEFDWDDVSDPSGVTYQIQVYDTDDLSVPVINKSEISVSEYTAQTSLSQGEYQWKVRATDTAGNTGSWSTTYTFYINNVPVLLWTEESGYVNDGIEPDAGTHRTDEWTYRVKYVDKDNSPPDYVRLKIDADGDGKNYEDYSMFHETGDGDYTNGEIYFYVYESTFSYQDNPKYEFSASDGLSPAVGKPTEEQSGPVIGFPITFYDPEPVDSQNSQKVECRIKAVTPEGAEVSIDTATAKYRIYDNTQIKNSSASVKCLSINKNKSEALFSVSTDSFKIGDNNYIQWLCRDSQGEEWRSSLNRVKVSSNRAPEVIITQPLNNGRSTLNPVIKANAIDPEGNIDRESVKIRIREIDGADVLFVSGENTPDLYDHLTEIVSYTYNGNDIKENRKYKVTVSAGDAGYEVQKISTDTVVFTAVEEDIPGVVNYPNPFDPKKGKTTIVYVLKEDAFVTINIYDTGRKLVRNLINKQERSRGEHREEWSGENLAGRILANGIYLCEIIAEGSKEYRAYQKIAIFGE